MDTNQTELCGKMSNGNRPYIMIAHMEEALGGTDKEVMILCQETLVEVGRDKGIITLETEEVGKITNEIIGDMITEASSLIGEEEKIPTPGGIKICVEIAAKKSVIEMTAGESGIVIIVVFIVAVRQETDLTLDLSRGKRILGPQEKKTVPLIGHLIKVAEAGVEVDHPQQKTKVRNTVQCELLMKELQMPSKQFLIKLRDFATVNFYSI